MEYLEDEMDDLFRKAGEQYPLKTSDSDWDAVLGRLQSADGSGLPPLSQNGKKRNNNRRLFWLLLLFPLGLLGLIYFGGTPGNGKIRPTDLAKVNAPKVNAPLKSIDKQSDKMQSAHLQTNPEQAAPAQTSESNTASTVPAHVISSGISIRKPVSGLSGETQDHVAQTTPDQKKHAVADLSTKSNTAWPKANTLANLDSKQDAVANQEEASGIDPDTKKPSDIPAIQKAAGDHTGIAASKSQDNATQPEKQKQDSAKKGDSKQATADKKDKKKARVSTVNEKGIYLSLLAGPDFSTVKFQSIKNTGYSIGILAGYRFNKNISLETGIFWDKKQYYSDGKYFNKSKTDIPASYNIEDLNGNCNMFEIPVSLRYDFSYNPRGRFFSTAGLSTYLMKKENYSYKAEYGGSAWSHDVSYKNSGNNLFSILQLSAGYEYNWGKIGRIRIEPYLKIPLTGVGIGQLPISSAGLQLGITHSFR